MSAGAFPLRLYLQPNPPVWTGEVDNTCAETLVTLFPSLLMGFVMPWKPSTVSDRKEEFAAVLAQIDELKRFFGVREQALEGTASLLQ